MAYILDNVAIRAPHAISEKNSTQLSSNRTLVGNVGRFYYGLNKRIWILDYKNTKPVHYNKISDIYQSYLNTGDTKAWEITENSYIISETQVHVEMLLRQFNVGGESYISDFQLILTEA